MIVIRLMVVFSEVISCGVLRFMCSKSMLKYCLMFSVCWFSWYVG